MNDPFELPSLQEIEQMERILIVDDEPDITFSLKFVLQVNGFASVDTFNDPAEVISKYNNQPKTMYDLLTYYIDACFRNSSPIEIESIAI